MKVIRKRKCNDTVYKQRCCKCRSTLAVDFNDLKRYYASYRYTQEWYFSCPICGTQQFLNKKNTKRANLYNVLTAKELR